LKLSVNEREEPRIFPLYNDEIFQDLEVPGPTRQEIRAVSISKMIVFRGCKVLEVGTGTGAVAYELQRLGCYVVSLERNWDFARRAKGRLRDLELINAISTYFRVRTSSFHNVFIGGTFDLRSSVELAFSSLKQGGRVVINTVTVESPAEAIKWVDEVFGNYEVVSISLARGKKVGEDLRKLTILKAENPVTIIYASKS